MPDINFAGANRMPVRTGLIVTDTNWANPATTITEADFDSKFWGVSPMRGGGLGPLKQLKLDVIFLDASDNEVGDVTFDYYTFDVILREEMKLPKGTTGRPFIRKTGAGAAFKCEESMIVDVNGTQAMGIRFSSFVDNSGTAVKYVVSATPVEYS